MADKGCFSPCRVVAMTDCVVLQSKVPKCSWWRESW